MEELILKRINELKEWQFKAQDLVKFNEYIKGYNQSVNYEIEFLRSLLLSLKKT